MIEKLLKLGAREVKGTRLKADHGCSVDVRAAGRKNEPVVRLQLDCDGAGYPTRGDGTQERMCDFAAFWCSGDNHAVGLFEMKSGAIRPKVVDQLQCGLDLLAGLDADKELVALRACLVGGKQTQQLKKLLQTRSRTRVRYRERWVAVEVLPSGQRVIVE